MHYFSNLSPLCWGPVDNRKLGCCHNDPHGLKTLWIEEGVPKKQKKSKLKQQQLKSFFITSMMVDYRRMHSRVHVDSIFAVIVSSIYGPDQLLSLLITHSKPTYIYIYKAQNISPTNISWLFWGMCCFIYGVKIFMN